MDVLRGLATLLEAGVPLPRALDEAESGSTGPNRAALAQIRAGIERGDSFAGALAAIPGWATGFEIALIQAGERSGDLAGAIGRVADQAERERELKSTLATAAIYPAVLAVVGGLSVLVMLLFVVPRFADLFGGAGATLPASTALLLSLSAFPGDHAFALVLGLVGVTIGVAAIGGSVGGRELASRVVLAAPGLSRIRRTQLGARYARLAGTLLAGGAPIGAALRHVAESFGDPTARREAERVAEAVREGSTLTSALAGSSVFAGTIARMAALGEETGRLATLLERAADSQESALRRDLDRLTKLFEPAMTVFFGLVIGLIAVALLQAVYGVNAGAFG
ncbi:MAG: type II secretion system F family protein [Gemmatimonadota bacterium]